MLPERRWLVSTYITSLGVLFAGCHGDPGVDLDLTGQHIGFAFESDARELCAGSVSHLDRYIEHSFQFFGASVPPNFEIPVKVVVEAPCDATACYRPTEGAVYVEALDWSTKRPGGVLRHELAHAVVDQVWGTSAPFFTEGLAEAIAGSGAWTVTQGPTLPIGDLLGEVPQELDYTGAALFTRFLIDTYGLARFKQLFQGARDLSGPEIKELFTEVYAESFDAIEAKYLDGSPRCLFQLDICDPQTGTPLADAWSASLAASCSDPDFYGSRGADDMTIGSQRTLIVEQAGTYRIITAFESPSLSTELARAQIVLSRCGDCTEQSVDLFYDQSMKELELEAGLYTFEIIMPFDTVVSLAIERLDAP